MCRMSFLDVFLRSPQRIHHDEVAYIRGGAIEVVQNEAMSRADKSGEEQKRAEKRAERIERIVEIP